MLPPRERDPNLIFVFGSNLAGLHGKGSAKEAARNWGAEFGVGHGRTGQAYAIPTKNTRLKTLDQMSIKRYVHQFITYAINHPDLTFNVVAIGTGLAGYEEHDIAPMFAGAPLNCNLPQGWRNYDEQLRSIDDGAGDDTATDSGGAGS